MKSESGLFEVVGLTQDCPNGNRGFSVSISPEAVVRGKWLGLFPRKTITEKINLLTLQEIVSRTTLENKELGCFLKELTEINPGDRRLFFYQPNLELGNEHFVVLVTGLEYEKDYFDRCSISVSMNKHFWKVAQKNDIVVVLDTDGNDKIYINGKNYRYGYWQKYVLEYANLYSALDSSKKLFDDHFIIDMSSKKRDENDSPEMIMFSDTHLADKTEIDNFGETKEKNLVKMFNGSIGNEGTPVAIIGDFYDLWQTTFSRIESAYSGEDSIIGVLSKAKTLILIAGNHDEDILENPKVSNWAKRMLPNAIILPSAIIISNSFDAVIQHGDRQDPANNHTVFGKTVSKVVAHIERIVSYFCSEKGSSNVEGYLMDFLRTYLAPTKSLVDSDIMRNLTSLIADINTYLFWNRMHLAYSNEPKRKLALCMGHTHRLIRHDDWNPIQQVLKAIIDEFLEGTPELKRSNKSYLLNKVEIRYINSGAGSGQTLEAEIVQDKFRWKLIEKLSKGKNGEDFSVFSNPKERKLNPRQNSVIFYGDCAGVSISYTTDDYCNPSHPTAF